jgi:lysophospholipase L1-like esterase
MAVVGDSVSEADSPNFAAGAIGPGSWVSSALGEGIVFAGGWANGGATSAQMLQAAAPVAADVLVIVAGVNDSGQGIPFATTAANLRGIASAVGAPRVVLATVPPRDRAPAVATTYNQRLRELATAQGWEFVDAMAGVRAGERYRPGMTVDGVHPSVAGAATIGAAMRDYLSQPH